MTRFFELVLACLTFIALFLPMLLVAIVVRLHLGSPVFFSQMRAGQFGKPFAVRKFRTMTNARDPDGNLLPDDERQTWLTRLLRRSRLDETPQLLNILAGQMSFVGPRPLLPETIAQHGERGALRCTVRPGVTGWAQISGNTQLGEEEKIALDLWYIKHRSLFLDLRILLETVAVAIRGERRNSSRLAEAQSFLAEPEVLEA